MLTTHCSITHDFWANFAYRWQTFGKYRQKWELFGLTHQLRDKSWIRQKRLKIKLFEEFFETVAFFRIKEIPGLHEASGD